ncbi:MAG: formylmethanofuran dehydrogenase subunit E family protein [Candidatus Bipolaricaulota bacterium]|nr:formylmethanofuran dehydrogenase subunit E family protein [Candidatus Bipolaricaulota bacterium]MDW8152072.1 formylmethanofuran dehydrogenase subunit E family protein [Candidatus Bipolaricaulota bacterium]
MNFLVLDPRADARELFGLAVRLHGHPGPFLALGVRMGLLALRLLGSPGYRGITAAVETGTTPPLSCLVDGVQVATGCTAGKGNLQVLPQGRAAATFAAGGKAVRIEVRPEWLSRLQKEGAGDHLAEAVLTAREEELFAWTLS